MAIPAYADPRSHKFFTRGFVGSKAGEEGTNYSTYWNSHSETVPTTVYSLRSDAHVCAWCGNRPFPLQDAYLDVIGYICVCKDAMDEVELIAEYQALLKEQAQARQALKDKLPKPSQVVLDMVVDKTIAKIKDDLARNFFVDSALDSLDIKLHTTHHLIKD